MACRTSSAMTCSIVSCRSSGESASPWSLVSISSTSRWSMMSSAMTSSSGLCSGAMRFPSGSRSGGFEALTQPAQGLGDESGDLHLGDAHVVGDLLLRPALEEAEGEDASIARGEPREQRPDGEHVLD